MINVRRINKWKFITILNFIFNTPNGSFYIHLLFLFSLIDVYLLLDSIDIFRKSFDVSGCSNEDILTQLLLPGLFDYLITAAARAVEKFALNKISPTVAEEVFFSLSKLPQDFSVYEYRSIQQGVRSYIITIFKCISLIPTLIFILLAIIGFPLIFLLILPLTIILFKLINEYIKCGELRIDNNAHQLELIEKAISLKSEIEIHNTAQFFIKKIESCPTVDLQYNIIKVLIRLMGGAYILIFQVLAVITEQVCKFDNTSRIILTVRFLSRLSSQTQHIVSIISELLDLQSIIPDNFGISDNNSDNNNISDNISDNNNNISDNNSDNINNTNISDNTNNNNEIISPFLFKYLEILKFANSDFVSYKKIIMNNSGKLSYIMNSIKSNYLIFNGHIAYLPADSQILNLSIFDNLKFGINCSDSMVIDKLKDQGLYELVEMKLVESKYNHSNNFNLLDYLKNKSAMDLSTGQIRIVCLLRTILSSAQIKIYDHPFNNIDEYTISHLIDAIYNGSTYFIINSSLSDIYDTMEVSIENFKGTEVLNYKNKLHNDDYIIKSVDNK